MLFFCGALQAPEGMCKGDTPAPSRFGARLVVDTFFKNYPELRVGAGLSAGLMGRGSAPISGFR